MIEMSLPEVRYASFVGIVVAISGNILISFALNCQKLAHQRLEVDRNSSSSTPTQDIERGRRTPTQESFSTLNSSETQPLLLRETPTRGYSQPLPRRTPSPGLLQINVETASPQTPTNRMAPIPVPVRSPARLKGARLNNTTASGETILEEIHTEEDADLDFGARTERQSWIDGSEGSAPKPNGMGNGNGYGKSPTPPNGKNLRFQSSGAETEYLKSKLWWSGFLLLNVGELGNFLSYAFAPASVVAPLGTFALIANCFFAPLMLKEKFHKRDLLGILICIIGAVTVVFASKSSDVRLDPAGLLHAIQRVPFVIYVSLSVAAALALGFLSEQSVGHQFVYIDVGLCAIFGGFTVLATKGISTLLSLEGLNIFKEPITYVLIVVLAGTGVGQVKYLNRALMSFDSKVVIPTQFVLFTLAAIIGSAILYRDFDNISFSRFITFVYGCATTFLGVFVLTRPDINLSPPVPSSIESTPRVTPHGLPSTALPTPRTMRIPVGTPVLRTRKSSRASLVLSSGYLLLATSPASPSPFTPAAAELPIARTRTRSVSRERGWGATAAPSGVSPGTSSSTVRPGSLRM